MQFLDKRGLETLLIQLLRLFGYGWKDSHKTTKQFWKNVNYRTTLNILHESTEARRTNLLEIDYDSTLKFDTNFIVGGSATSAMTGIATCGAAIAGNS